MPAADTKVLLDVLRWCVASPGDAQTVRALRGVDDSAWRELPAVAEAHGVSPLVHRHLIDAGVTLPPDVRHVLFGLAAVHRAANDIRFAVLRQVLDAFDGASIPVLVLKGAALAHILYPSWALRPCGDIDLLVSPPDGDRAQAVLANLGFRAPARASDPRFADHHHLPPATTVVERQLVQVEIHTNAFSRDARASLTLEDCWDRKQAFAIRGRSAFAAGHHDMLHHLTRHAAEPSRLFRVILAVDTVKYAERFCAEIDWARMRRESPSVVNALGLLHLVVPLPRSVLDHVPVPAAHIAGVGVARRPLTEIAGRRPAAAALAELLVPDEWWLRLNYGAANPRAVRWYRWIGHPARVVWWLVRRSGVRLRSRAGIRRIAPAALL